MRGAGRSFSRDGGEGPDEGRAGIDDGTTSKPADERDKDGE